MRRAVLVERGRPASEVCSLFTPLPQKLQSVRFTGRSPLQHPQVLAAVAEAEASLGASGRLLLCESGTEPVVRVMAEGEDEALVARLVSELCGAIESAAEPVA